MMEYPVIDLQATGSNILKLRRKSGLYVAEIQKYFGFEYPTAIYKWQKGESLPTVDNLLALSLLFHKSMNEILVYEGQNFCLQKIFNLKEIFNYQLKEFNQQFIESCK